MHGFCDAPGNKTPGGDGSGLLQLAPAPSCHNYSLSALSGLEEGGNAGVNTPKLPPGSQCSVVTCVSPLASQEFSEVFADTPRLLAPRWSRRSGGGAAGKGAGGSSKRALASPGASALHAAEQNLSLDDLMQIFETTPVTNLSPVATDGVRRAAHDDEIARNRTPLTNLQLPLVGSSMSGVMDSASAVHSLSKNPKKRKSPTNAALSDQHQPGSTTPPSAVKCAPLEGKEGFAVQPSRKTKRSRKNKAPSSARSRRTAKRVRKSPPKICGASPEHENDVSGPADQERIAAAIQAVNAAYGDGAEKEEKLAAVTLRGVTARPSGKWQAQLYFSGKSRYLGVYGSKEQASLAYEIAREVLKADQPQKFPASAEDVDRNFALARKAAEAGVTEQYG